MKNLKGENNMLGLFTCIRLGKQKEEKSEKKKSNEKNWINQRMEELNNVPNDMESITKFFCTYKYSAYWYMPAQKRLSLCLPVHDDELDDCILLSDVCCKLMAETRMVRRIQDGSAIKTDACIDKIVINAKSGSKFPVQPNYVTKGIAPGMSQYIWQLSVAFASNMWESIQLFVDALAYFVPGSKNVTLEEFAVVVPGIVNLRTKQRPKFHENCIFPYELNNLWNIVGAYFPVRSRALRRFLDSDKIYAPDLHTTLQFIGLDRYNKMMEMEPTKKQMADDDYRRKFTFWCLNFLLEIGYTRTQARTIFAHPAAKYGIPDHVVEECMPHKCYSVRNSTLVEIFGKCAEKLFPVHKNKGVIEKGKQMMREVADLVMEGLNTAQIAKKLKISESMVKRRRSQAARENLIESIHEKITGVKISIAMLASKGMSISQIAEKLNISISKVKRLRSKVVKEQNLIEFFKKYPELVKIA